MTERIPLTALLAMVLPACTMVGPDYQPPPEPQLESFSEAGESGFGAAQLEIKWWRAFNDPVLDRLVELALADNPDLRVATARLREARAFRREIGYDRYPTVQTQADIVAGRDNELSVPPGSDRDFELFDAGFDAFWELDFFGRVRRQVEARSAEEQAFEADRRDVAVSLIAEVARNYIELRGAQQRLDVAFSNAANQEETLHLTNMLLAGGRGNALDVARAEAQLGLTRASIYPLETLVRQSLHALAVLTGRPPGAVDGELAAVAPIPELPRIIGIETPAELLRRRPDIRAAERRLAAFTAGIGIAVADLFPRVNLLGSAHLTAAIGSDLLAGDAVSMSIGPSITWLAAFDLARVRARIEQAEARAEGAFAQYERTVLAALEDVENALVAFARERSRYAELARSEHASTQAARLARERYQDGVATFLEVLDAERVQLAAQDELVASQTAAAIALTALYKALGGGWEDPG